MKKVIFLIASIATFGLMSFTNSSNVEIQNPNDIITYASTPVTITVYKITSIGATGGITAKRALSAEFDDEKMKLYVEENVNGRTFTATYSVCANPYKGSDGSRGRYDYKAGDYYFNY